MEEPRVSARDLQQKAHCERHEYEPITCEDTTGPMLASERHLQNGHRIEVGGRSLEYLLRYKMSLGCNVEKETIYGFAIALPQIARSTGWSNITTGLAIRSVFFLLLTFFIQGLFMYMMYKEQHVMERFSGQMNLCDFGAFIERCHDAGDEAVHVPGCRGPAGTTYTAARLYSWPQWADRQFVKESLLALFPHMREAIENKVDPGEWGLEDYWCRLACCFVFVMMVNVELLSIFRMLKLFWVVPSVPQSWVRYGGDLTPGHIPTMADIELRVAGIPFGWKMSYLLLIVIPRVIMCKFVCECGITFLMESAGITEVIVNALALGFVLGIGNMIVMDFTVRAAKDVMVELTDYDNHLEEEEEMHERNNTIEHVSLYQHSSKRRLKLMFQLIPLRFLAVCLLTVVLVYGYYTLRCVRDEHGHWISKPLYLPKTVDIRVWSAILPRVFPIETDSEPYWEMPEQ